MAPTSTPRVGSSKMIRSRLLHQRLGDHHLLLVAAGELDHLGLVADRADFQRLIQSAPTCLASRCDSSRGRAGLRQQAEIDVARDRHGLEEALDLAVLGDIGDAVAHRRRRHAVAHRLVAQQHLAAVEEVALQHAGDDLEGLGAAGADQAEDAGDLAGEDRERVVPHHRRHVQVLHRQHALAGRCGPSSCARRRACWTGRARPSPG